MGSRATVAIMVMLSLAIAVASARPVQARPNKPAPRLAGALLEVEEQILQALQAMALTDRLIGITADTNGHLTVAALLLTYSGPPSDPLAAHQAYAWSLVRTAFMSVPALDEVHLTGVQQDATSFEANHPKVTFSAAVSREEFLRVPRGILANEKFAMVPRVWYHHLLSQPDSQPRNQGAADQPVPPTPLPPAGRRVSGRTGETPPKFRHPIALRPKGERVGNEIYRGDLSRRTVAITFDDGPFPIYTTLLLDTLDRLGVKATFFLVGEQVQQYPYFAQAIVRGGHEVGNHTFHHANLTRLPAAQVFEEIAHAQEAIAGVTGQAPRYFRPPGGNFNGTVLRTARDLGLTTVFWTANSGDYTGLEPQALEAKVLAHVSNGGIMLFHQGMENTLRILPQMTEVLRRRGFTITTVSGLVAHRGPDSAR